MPALGGTNSFFQGQPLQVQSTPSAEDRFLPLPARSQGQSLGPAQGRLDPFAALFGYDRYLRKAAIPNDGLRDRARGQTQPKWPAAMLDPFSAASGRLRFGDLGHFRRRRKAFERRREDGVRFDRAAEFDGAAEVQPPLPAAPQICQPASAA